MMSDRHSRATGSFACLLLVTLFAAAIAQPAMAQAQQSATVASGPPENPMRALAPPIVQEMKDKEQIDGIVVNRVVTKQEGQPVKLTGFTTQARQGNSGRRVLNNNQTLDFQVDTSSPQEVVITVRIDKSVLAGNPNEPIQTDYMSIGFVRGTASCWQECWKEGGQKICERVCYD